MRNEVVSCIRQGSRVEQVFRRTVERYGFVVVREASSYENMFEHWDFLVDIDGREIRVDVKDQRKRQRYDKMLQNMVMVEWKNIGGWDGWIYGCADVIAFRIDGLFHLIPRVSLLEYALGVVDFDKKAYCFADCVNCVYSRVDRYDLMSLIDVSCIPFEYNILKIGE